MVPFSRRWKWVVGLWLLPGVLAGIPLMAAGQWSVQGLWIVPLGFAGGPLMLDLFFRPEQSEPGVVFWVGSAVAAIGLLKALFSFERRTFYAALGIYGLIQLSALGVIAASAVHRIQHPEEINREEG
ncbi:MAG: hypothetical protein JWO82_3218 [Akkermansiaceae bacterium]|nr:hypothetical protein [Akkermansiaceae bacterium]